MKPDTKIPLFEEEEDTGKFVAGILAHVGQPSGQRIFGATDWYTMTDAAATIEKISGKKTTFTSLPDEVFKGFLPPQLATELVETFSFIHEYAYFGAGAEEGLTESLKVRMSTWS